jgi:hypothetical protein
MVPFWVVSHRVKLVSNPRAVNCIQTGDEVAIRACRLFMAQPRPKLGKAPDHSREIDKRLRRGGPSNTTALQITTI